VKAALLLTVLALFGCGYMFYTSSDTRPPCGRTYSEEVLVDQPVGYWRLGEAAGLTANDISGYGNHGTYVNVTLGSPGVLPDANAAASFNGANSRVFIPASTSLDTGAQITMEAWIKPAGAAANPILEYNNGAVTGPHLWQNPFDRVQTNMVDSGGGGHSISGPASMFTAGTWYHVAAIYTGSYEAAYINGVEVVNLTPGSFTLRTTFDFYIGARITGNFFNGLIDEVAVYNKPVSAVRLLAHYNARDVGACVR
jgi:hypothetical protein